MDATKYHRVELFLKKKYSIQRINSCHGRIKSEKVPSSEEEEEEEEASDGQLIKEFTIKTDIFP